MNLALGTLTHYYSATAGTEGYRDLTGMPTDTSGGTLVDLQNIQNKTISTAGGKMLDTNTQVYSLAVQVISIGFFQNLINTFDSFFFGTLIYLEFAMRTLDPTVSLDFLNWLFGALRILLGFMMAMGVIWLFTGRDIFGN